jgi:anti-sigma B factor antagonist
VQVNIESRKPGITIMHPTGGLEMSNVSAFRKTLQAEIKQAKRGLIMLLDEVPFIDSSGVAVLIEGLKWSRERHLPDILVCLTSGVQMVIELARLESFFTITDTLEDALALFPDAS